MRIPHSQFYDYLSIISKIEFDVGGDLLFFPMEVDDKSKMTEYGTILIENKTPETQSWQPSCSLVTGMVMTPSYVQEKDKDGNMQTRIDKMIGSLAYCKDSDMVKFDIIEYMSLIKQENISEEEQKKLASIECYIVDRKSVKISRLQLM
jgi:hypothetical protein